MKVKLLKKVRKRYSIVRVDELASNPCAFDKFCKQQLGLPFYKLKDHSGSRSFMSYEKMGFSTFSEARISLCKWILADYGEKFRHKDSKQEKVWY